MNKGAGTVAKVGFVAGLLGLLLWWPSDLPASAVLKRGVMQVDTTSSSHEDSLWPVWPRGSVYTFPDSAESLFVSTGTFHSNGQLTGVEAIQITGLGSNWERQTDELERSEISQTTPITKVVSKFGTKTWRRVNAIEVLGDTVNVDTVWILASRSINAATGVPTTASHVRGVLPPRTGRDVQMIYTVPDGHEAKLLSATIQPMFSTAVSAVQPDSAIVEVFIRVRKENGVFQTYDSRQVAGRTYDIRDIEFVYPRSPNLPARADVVVAVGVTTGATVLNMRGSLLLDEQ